jgi:hypothetical protein
VRVRRRGNAAVVSWHGPVTTYNVTVHTGDGRRLLFIRRRAGAVRVPLARRYGLSAAVRAMRLDGVEGRPGTAKLRRAR